MHNVEEPADGLQGPDQHVQIGHEGDHFPDAELALTNQIAPVEQANQIGGPHENQDHGLEELIVLSSSQVLSPDHLVGGMKLSRLLGSITKGLGHLNTGDRFLN